MSNKNQEKKKEESKNRKWLLLFLLLLLLFLGIGFWLFMNRTSSNNGSKIITNTIDTSRVSDSLNQVQLDSIAKFKLDSIAQYDSLLALSLDRKKREKFIKDSLDRVMKEKLEQSKLDSLNALKDSIENSKNQDKLTDGLLIDGVDTKKKVEVTPCQKDTVAPWVYPNPTGGLYHKKLAVKLICDDPSATVEWRVKGKSEWRKYVGRTISVESNMTICYRAVDSCENRLDEKCKSYEIKKSADATKCPDDMTYIKVGNNRFCIDKYEWPNKKRKLPSANVSLYQAQDSCFAAGKRLCKTPEWSLACAGAYSWKYAYGVKYEKQACVTREKSVQKTGSRAECRGYFEVFDMSGNLAEWTDTRSKKNQDFYNVMGGFWQSGSQSTCYKPRYSYYPQNRHNPFGFRCCKDSEE